jgi:beta-glucanase (GH16 family)
MHLCAAVTVIAGVGASVLGISAPARAQGKRLGHTRTDEVAGRAHATRRSAVEPKPLGVRGTWALILNSRFTGTKLNGGLWRPGWFGTGTTGPINGNELACYDSANATVPGNNSLELSLTATASRCKSGSLPYTGAMVSTNPYDGRSSGGFAFTYGLVQVRLYVPALGGHILNWPAVMTLGQNWPADGEDDILEGLDGRLCHRFHSPQNIAMGAGGCLSNAHGGWYTIAADFEPGSVTWYYNGTRVGSTTEVTDASMYLAIDYSASNKSPQFVAPTTLRVAYVRVWQHPAAMSAGIDRSQF